MYLLECHKLTLRREILAEACDELLWNTIEVQTICHQKQNAMAWFINRKKRSRLIFAYDSNKNKVDGKRLRQ
jgi:hypothetical protein